LASAALTFALISAAVFDSQGTPGEISLVIAIACLANLFVATLSGSAIPLILRKLGLDPALAASILLTVITDVVGFGGFLLVAAWLL
jgi:magnesium transporter